MLLDQFHWLIKRDFKNLEKNGVFQFFGSAVSPPIPMSMPNLSVGLGPRGPRSNDGPGYEIKITLRHYWHDPCKNLTHSCHDPYMVHDTILTLYLPDIILILPQNDPDMTSKCFKHDPNFLHEAGRPNIQKIPEMPYKTTTQKRYWETTRSS